MCVEGICEMCILLKDDRQEDSSMSANISMSRISISQFQSPKAKRKSIDGGYNSGEEIVNVDSSRQRKLTNGRKCHSASEIDSRDAHLDVNYQLETIETGCSSVFRRITPKILLEAMGSMTAEEFDEKFIILDCRFPYEYDGGHVKNAHNITDTDHARNFFFDDEGKRKLHAIPIFYCEYSQKRGPRMAQTLRCTDRFLNPDMYPQCAYEEIYVLDGGYRQFHKYAREQGLSETFCSPDEYVEMTDPKFMEEFENQGFYKKLTRKMTHSKSANPIGTAGSGARVSLLRKTASTSSCAFKERFS